MNNLTAVQRPDKTGKVVTRHVRTDPKQLSKHPALPGPVLAASTPDKPVQGNIKPRPKQLEVKPRSFVGTYLNFGEGLMSQEGKLELWDTKKNYRFEASAVQMYDVLSVVENNGDAVIMLEEGVRSAEEAQQYLIDHGAEHLITDRSEMMQEALEKNLDADLFITTARHTNKWGKKVDAALFFNSSLNRNANGLVIDDIVNGSISYDDIKTLGATKLKPFERLYRLSDLLKSVQRGETTIEKVQSFLDRAIKEELSTTQLAYAVSVLEERGMDIADKVTQLKHLSDAYDVTHFPFVTAELYGETKMDRAVYLARMASDTDGNVRYNNNSYNDLFEAGIPIETAIIAVNRGGGLLQAKAMHEEGINENLAEGWL